MKTTRIFLGSMCALAALGILIALTIQGCGSGAAPAALTENDSTPAADSIGEALFLDTRFAEYFAEHMTDVNTPLATGDPVVEQVQTTNGTLPGPFAGQSINCRSCHFVTEFQGVSGAGNRTYSDFTTRSPIPRMTAAGFDHTPRNAMQMVDSFTTRPGSMFLHFDGEFATGEDLVIGTLTGRNFGWTPAQYSQAIAHIAKVIREDNGSSQLAADRLDGLSYAVIFKGTDSRITSDILLPPSQRLDVSTATDLQIVNEVALCITTYMKDLLFQRDAYGRYIGSPYDNFLRVNHLSQAPLAGETKAAYNQRLLNEVMALKNPTYITPSDGSYKYPRAALSVRGAGVAGIENIPVGSECGDGERTCGQLRGLPPGAGLLGFCIPITTVFRRLSTTRRMDQEHLCNWPFPPMRSVWRTSTRTCRLQPITRMRWRCFAMPPGRASRSMPTWGCGISI